MASVPIDIAAVLRRAALVDLAGEPEAIALQGGVSSDIWRVKGDGLDVCVKRALPKLKVRADWRVPVERSGFEARWMEVAAGIVPEAVPKLLHVDASAGALVMEHLDPASFRSWKEELRQGRVDVGTAGAVGEVLVQLHAATARRDELAARFPSDALFHELRLAPYLLAAAAVRPEVERPLRRLARRTATTKLALVHGDVSPKNILIGERGPVLLDAECAVYGDPAFDLAFCLNHLLLKCLWTPRAAPGFLACFDAMTATYLRSVRWEPVAELERRTARLLPGLFLARVDGKSPVEYLTDENERNRVRKVATELLRRPVARLADVRAVWAKEVGA